MIDKEKVSDYEEQLNRLGMLRDSLTQQKELEELHRERTYNILAHFSTTELKAELRRRKGKR